MLKLVLQFGVQRTPPSHAGREDGGGGPSRTRSSQGSAILNLVWERQFPADLGLAVPFVRARVSDYNDLHAGGEACKGDEGARSEGMEEEPC